MHARQPACNYRLAPLGTCAHVMQSIARVARCGRLARASVGAAAACPMVPAAQCSSLAPAAEPLGTDWASIVHALGKRMKASRMARVTDSMARRTGAVAIVLESVHDPHNVAAVLRTVECFGFVHVHIIHKYTESVMGGSSAQVGVARGAGNWLQVHSHHSTADCVAALRRSGAYIAATGFTEGSHTLQQVLDQHFPAEQQASSSAAELSTAPAPVPQLALVFGNEQRGVSKAMAAAADCVWHIPMAGLSQSLNVSVAAGIALHATGAHMERTGHWTPLGQADMDEIIGIWLLRKVPSSGNVLDKAGVPRPADW